MCKLKLIFLALKPMEKTTAIQVNNNKMSEMIVLISGKGFAGIGKP
jgi:hypothetical protein